MVIQRRPLTFAALALCALIPFQNCGQHMAASKSGTANSSQCKAQFKAEAVAAKMAPNFNCEDFNNYSCERRIFSPEIESMTHFMKECVGTGNICVDVEVRQFSTASAKSFEPQEKFLFGAEYNREEFRCHHKYFYQNLAVFEGQGESMEEALAAAMNSCEHASEAP